ncbi:ABC transporter substrate-binding protein [Ramlibacter sp.]|uniref:ABC transporter substrate-binding protein n=1 Tax=Ramlibacter sp. TaxID=1917967 RepID=UPI002D38F202|nr:ABC transporter substrate-binding protein [Ramlibacter sp.]HYD75045.1 ABC transporter substrate-binding protein [Ramlibacter sp.]
MFRSPFARASCAALLALAAVTASAQDTSKVLRMVPQTDLKILDPIWTTAFVTRDHGYMVYDTLFGVNVGGQPQPQMVDKYTASADAKVWNFTLRKGLVFHDGKPVTAADVVASLNRWGQRDSLGQRMLAAMDKMEAVGDDAFRMTFKQPFGLVLEALSKPSGSPAFIMPKRVADTPADKQIDDYTGSGPYVFKKDEFRPGEKVVYLKHKGYVPRSDSPSGTAGGKHVYVDRVEWIILKDAQTQSNAITSGEVDLLSWMPPEHYSTLRTNPKLETVQPTFAGSYYLHLNHHIPPFDNPKIAKAAVLAVNQEALLRGQMVFRDLYRTCATIYPCNSPLATQPKWYTGKPKFEEARQLLKEAGYDGTPIVLMHPADFTLLNKLPPVMAQLLQQAGFKVELQSMDWPTLLMRRAKKDPVDKGGWNAFMTGWGGSDTLNPMFFAPLTGNGEKGWFGWNKDDRLEALKGAFTASTDAAERKRLAAEIQERALETGLFAPLGETNNLTVIRRGVVSGVLLAPVNVFWNIKKN